MNDLAAATVRPIPAGSSLSQAPLPEPSLFAAVVFYVLVLLVAGLVGSGSVQLGKWAGLDGDAYEFIFTAAATFAVVLVFVRSRLGGDLTRALAVRRLNWGHALLVILFAPAFYVMVAALNAALMQAVAWVGLGEGLLASSEVSTGIRKAAVSLPGGAASVLAVIAASVLTGVHEELFSRGFVGRGLVAHYGAWGGIALTALLFGLSHLDPVHSVVTCVGSVVFHASYLWSRSLLAPILLHALFNVLVSTVVLAPKATAVLWNPSVGVVLASVAAAAGLCALWRANRVRWLLPDGCEWRPGYVTAETPPAEVKAVAIAAKPGRGVLLVAVIMYGLFIAVLGWQWT